MVPIGKWATIGNNNWSSAENSVSVCLHEVLWWIQTADPALQCSELHESHISSADYTEFLNIPGCV